MSLPLEYGRRYTMTTDGDVITYREEVFAGFELKKNVELNVETKMLKSADEFLAHCVDLDKRYRRGEIDLPGIQLLRDKHNGKYRVEKTWMPVV